MALACSHSYPRRFFSPHRAVFASHACLHGSAHAWSAATRPVPFADGDVGAALTALGFLRFVLACDQATATATATVTATVTATATAALCGEHLPCAAGRRRGIFVFRCPSAVSDSLYAHVIAPARQLCVSIAVFGVLCRVFCAGYCASAPHAATWLREEQMPNTLRKHVLAICPPPVLVTSLAMRRLSGGEPGGTTIVALGEVTVGVATLDAGARLRVEGA